MQARLYGWLKKLWGLNFVTPYNSKSGGHNDINKNHFNWVNYKNYFILSFYSEGFSNWHEFCYKDKWESGVQGQKECCFGQGRRELFWLCSKQAIKGWWIRIPSKREPYYSQTCHALWSVKCLIINNNVTNCVKKKTKKTLKTNTLLYISDIIDWKKWTFRFSFCGRKHIILLLRY